MKLKKYSFILICLMMLISFSLSSYAYNLELSMKESNKKFKPGEKVRLTVKFKEIDVEEINVYSGKIDYDKSVFEKLEKSNFITQDVWNNITYNEETGLFIIENDSKQGKCEDVFSIELKVKKDVKKESAVVSIINNVISNGLEEIEIEDKQFEINIENTNKNDENNIIFNYNKENDILYRIKAKTPVNEFKSFVLENSQNNVKVYKNNIEIDGGYIETGMTMKIYDENNRVIKENDKEIQYRLSVIGDVNGDGIANKIDSNLIKSFRNEIIELNDVYFKSADINNDRKVNVNDTKLLLYHRAEINGYCLNYSK